MTDLARLSVQDARRERLASQISSFTNLSLAAVRGRLARAHGRVLLRNLFADVWPSEPAVAPLAPVRAAPKKPVVGAPRTIHRVRQRFSTSCGVAVVAMFARVSHQQALKVLFPSPRRTFYTYLHQLKKAFDHFGVRFESSWHRFRSWNEIPKTSLVKVRCRGNGRTWYHWVIFQRRPDGTSEVIDPDPGRGGTQRLAKSELSAYEGLSYLAVEPVPPARNQGDDQLAERRGRR